ncbi:MAG: S8 family peptidase [Nitrososphaerota archaeon]
MEFLDYDDLPPTIGDAIQDGEPIYTLPEDERQPEMSLRADEFYKLAEDRDWGHSNLGIKDLYDKGYRGKGVVIAICDTGVSVNHPDLKSRIVEVGNKDFTGSNSGFLDRQGHGTHCAGIAAASANNQGIIGVAPEARIMAVKVLNDQGSGASSWIAAGIRWAADNGADIISLSLGGPSPDAATRVAVQYAASKGCWVVCAAGNDGREANSYPGHYPDSIAVVATDRENRRASFSTINSQNDVAAPGVSILSTLPDGRYGTMSGTSMATPYVSGCLALVRGAIKAAGKAIPNQSQMIELLHKESNDIPPEGVDKQTGGGLIHTARLIKLLTKESAPPGPGPEPEPTPSPTVITLKPGERVVVEAAQTTP